MKARILSGCSAAWIATAFLIGSAHAQMIVGTNLDGVSPWGANHFVDVFKNQSSG